MAKAATSGTKAARVAKAVADAVGAGKAVQVELAFSLDGYEPRSAVAQGLDGVVTVNQPLSKKPDLQNVAQKLAADLRQNEWMIDYDEAGAIGRRYRREDEIGTPLCVTVDFDTLDDQAVTIRERDTMQQERVSLDKVADYIAERIGEKRVSVPQMPVEMGGEAWPESVKIAEAGGLY